MTKLKKIFQKIKKLKLQNKLKKSNGDTTEKIYILQNSRTQRVTKLKNSNGDKTRELKL